MRKPDCLDRRTTQATDKLCLYAFFSSSCCQRITIAAHLKSIPLAFSYLDLCNGALAGKSSGELKLSTSVPTLVITHRDGTTSLVRGTIDILEYFEERFPNSYPLLPPRAEAKRRQLVRDFIDVITIDIEPPTSSRMARRTWASGGGLEEQEASATAAFCRSFAAYQALLRSTRRAEAETCLYTVGDEVTLADICLVPTVEQAINYKMDMSAAPHVMRIYNHLRTLPAFTGVDWRKHGRSERRL